MKSESPEESNDNDSTETDRFSLYDRKWSPHLFKAVTDYMAREETPIRRFYVIMFLIWSVAVTIQQWMHAQGGVDWMMLAPFLFILALSTNRQTH